MTHHSLVRAKERANLSTSSAKKNFERAYRLGLKAAQMPAAERQYMEERSDTNYQMLLYGDFLYLFAEDGICVTMFHTPPWFGKKSKFNGKERINNPKKYFNRYCLDSAYLN